MTAKSYFVNVYFDTPAPTSFSGSFITAVPEVSTWAMMILPSPRSLLGL